MSVRSPYVAGTFYPADPSELRQYCEAKLTPQSSLIQAKAILLPHAGYFYSGDTALRVLSQIEIPQTVVLIGPNHSGSGAPFSLYPEGEWETPLGRVKIERELAARLLAEVPLLTPDEYSHSREHSLEVEIPLLQCKRPDLRIVPLIVGTLELNALEAAAAGCAKVLSDWKDPFLLVISTDMSHYEPDEATRTKDRFALDAITHLSAEELIHAVRKHRITMCGLGPVLMLLAMKEKLGIKKSELVYYTTSAEASGDKSRVVGYAGFILE